MAVEHYFRLNSGSVISGERVPADRVPISQAVVARRLREDHDRIAQALNDVLARRLFAAGLDLHVALGLIGDHRAVGTILHAIDGLDQAIRELRNTAYDLAPRDGRLAGLR